MYFRNKFDEEFLYLANNIYPKGGSVRLDKKNPPFFEIIRPAFDDTNRRVKVIPLLLFNKIQSTYSDVSKGTKHKDDVIEDWMVLCQDRKDTIVKCTYDEKYESKQDNNFVCEANIKEITGDLEYDPDYDYEAVWYND